MSDRFDELLDPGKAEGLRKELRRLFPPLGNGIPRGYVYACAEPEYVGRFPVRSEIEIEIEPGRPACIGERELAKHGSVAVRVPVGIQGVDNTLGPEWTLGVGGTVLIRAAETGFFMVPLEKDAHGWFTTCGSERVDVTWSDKRQRWVHTTLPGRKG